MKKITHYVLVATMLASTVLTPIASAEATIPFLEQLIKPSNTSQAATQQQDVPTLAPVIKKVTPAVVNISTKTKVRVAPNPLLEDPMFRQFFNFGMPGMPQEQMQQHEREVQSVGSGVIVDAGKGYVLTNNHVVDSADEVYVTLKDKRRIKAEVIGKDKETDIAVLKIKASNLTSVPLGDSTRLEVGDFVIAVGNPFGLGQTVTSGMVSALGRNGLGIEGYENFIQTDAAINPGNSGGALINLRGELVGINTAILSRSGGNVGIGFAIPVDMAKHVMDQLVDHGAIERGQLGIHIQDVTPEIAEALGINANQGALVARVDKSSAADKAGVKEGDVVIKFNDSDVAGAGDLKNKVGLLRIGDKVTMEIVHKGKHQNITATISKRSTVSADTVASEVPLLKGAALGSLPDGNGKEGVLVTHVDPDSAAAMAGVEEGDIITSVNQKKVTNPAEVIEVAKKNSKSLLLNIQRGDAALFIVIQ